MKKCQGFPTSNPKWLAALVEKLDWTIPSRDAKLVLRGFNLNDATLEEYP